MRIRLLLLPAILTVAVGCNSNAPSIDLGGPGNGLQSRAKLQTITETDTETQTVPITATETDTTSSSSSQTSTHTQTLTSTRTETASGNTVSRTATTYNVPVSATNIGTVTDRNDYVAAKTYAWTATLTRADTAAATFTKTATATGTFLDSGVTYSGTGTATGALAFTGFSTSTTTQTVAARYSGQVSKMVAATGTGTGNATMIWTYTKTASGSHTNTITDTETQTVTDTTTQTSTGTTTTTIGSTGTITVTVTNTVTDTNTCTLATPTGLTVTWPNGGAQVALGWDEVPGATSYNIKRSAVSGGPYTIIASTTSASYADSTYSCTDANHYVVSAISSCGESSESQEATFALEQQLTPTTLCVNRFSDTSWNAVFGYVNDSPCTVTIPAGATNQLDPTPAESTGLPTTFLSGTHASAFMASFPGGSLTWTLGTHQVTAGESLPSCSTSDLPPSETPPPPLGAGSIPDMPSATALNGVEADTYGYYRVVDPLPGGPASVNYTSGGTSTSSIPQESNFQFTIFMQLMGDDVGDEVETDIDISLLGGDGQTVIATQYYDNPDDWGTWTAHTGNWPISGTVPWSETLVMVRVSINEHDDTGTDHWVRRLMIDNRTGQVLYVTNDSGLTLQTGPLTDHCVHDAGGAGWGFCWAPIQATGRSTICPSFLAEYIDSGYGQNYLEPWAGNRVSGRVQKVPASFGMAKYHLKNSVTQSTWGPVTIPAHSSETSVDYIALDERGCFPIDVAPNDQDMQYDKNGTLELEVHFRSEFCKDPTGANCPKDPADNTHVTSGTKFEVADKDGKTNEWCVIWTSDESLTSSECDVVHASQDAFKDWDGTTANLKYPPWGAMPVSSPQNSMTRVSGVVSLAFVRAVDSPDQVGSILVNPYLYKTSVDTFCKLTDPVGSGRQAVDGCAGSISPSFRCNPGQAVGECAYWLPATGEIVYEACDVSPSDPTCRPGLNYFKTAIAHEIGHQVHNANNAMPYYNYDLALPGLPKLCTCDHVTNANKMHCPQSVEYWGTGLLEGYAHTFASAVMNHESSIAENGCVFLYEKEIADETCVAANGSADCTEVTIDGKSVYLAKTPVKVNCDTPGLWRNRHCGGPGVNPTDPVANTSVELDIMGFLRAVTTRGTDSQRMSNSAFIGAMRDHIGAGKKVSWEGSLDSNGSVYEYSYQKDALLPSAGGNSNDPRYRWALDQADSYGVSTKVN